MTADLSSRIQRVQSSMTRAGVDALIVTPGSDLRYLTGYQAIALERLTALLLPAEGDPTLVVPVLEAAEAERTPAALAGAVPTAWRHWGHRASPDRRRHHRRGPRDDRLRHRRIRPERRLSAPRRLRSGHRARRQRGGRYRGLDPRRLLQRLDPHVRR